MAILVLTIRFLCEVAALVVLGWFGERAGGLALAVLLPVVAAVVWGAWVAPRARKRLQDPLRFAVESLVWTSAIASLVLLDRTGLAIGFGMLAFATAAAARRYEPGVVAADDAPRVTRPRP